MEVNDYQENYVTGWIKLHRSLKNHWIFDNDKFFKWWVLMLFEVNHKDTKFNLGYKLYDIKRGQSTKSLRNWSNIFGCGTKQVTNFFDLLEKDGMITRKTIGKGKHSTTLINIEHYKQYQGDRETQATTLETTQGKHKGNARGIQYNNDNNEKNDKKDTIKKFLDWFNSKKLQHTKKKGRSKVLTDTDYKNLIRLKENYTAKDFDHAIANLFNNEWAKDNNAFTPTHFLRNDNFNRYFEQEYKNPYVVVDNSPVN